MFTDDNKVTAFTKSNGDDVDYTGAELNRALEIWEVLDYYGLTDTSQREFPDAD